jgi:hypothetical protein
MKPLMKPREIALFKQELLKRKGKGTVQVLEWGSGGSTIHFTDFLEKEGIPYSWTSIEYNKVWYEKVQEVVKSKPDVSLVLFDVGNTVLKQRYVNMDDYVNYPNTLNKKFDVVFVDGRKRRRCVLLAKNFLKNDGVVFLHDAQRTYYQCSFKEFSNQRLIGPTFWKGSNLPVSPFQKLQNKIVHYFFKVVFYIIIKPFQIVRGLLQKVYHRYAK